MSLSMSTQTSFTADPDLGRALYSIVVRWNWPAGEGTDWTRFRLVRKINSPAARCEEGAILFETTKDDWGEPKFDDFSAPPAKWVYYSAFVLTPQRVWRKVDQIYEMGTGDYDWTLNLPESLPGVAVSNNRQVGAPPDAFQTLVEFLQGPGLIFDRIMSYAESMQYFWDPNLVPPPMLPSMLRTLGFHLQDSLDETRLREVAHAMIVEWPQGSLGAIRSFVRAATGYPAIIRRSNNQMLSVLDSSFESDSLTLRDPPAPPPAPPPPGPAPPPPEPPPPAQTWETYADVRDYFDTYSGPRDYMDSYGRLLAGPYQQRASFDPDSVAWLINSNWEPLDRDLLQLRRYWNFPNPPATLPVEVLDTFFLHFLKAGWIACGRQDPIRRGIPVSWWTYVRGGLFARSAVGAALTMTLELYDFDGSYLRTLPLIPSKALPTDWTWIHTPEQQPISVDQYSESLLLTEPNSWYSTWPDRAQPQNPPSIITRGGEDYLSFEWNPDPIPSGDIVNQPPTALQARLAPVPPLKSIRFVWEMAGSDHPDMTGVMSPWRQVILWPSNAETIPPPPPNEPPPRPPVPLPNTYETLDNSFADYDQVRNLFGTYDEVYNHRYRVFYQTGATTFNIFHGPWIRPHSEDRTAELTWLPPDGVADAWWGVEVLRSDTEDLIYRDLLGTPYGDTQTTYATYQTLKDAFKGDGWSEGYQHIAKRAEIRTGASGKPYWAVPVIQVSDEADIDLVVVDDV